VRYKSIHFHCFSHFHHLPLSLYNLKIGATVALGGVPATAIKSAMSLVAEGMKKA
jgi:hypothetical protein